VKIEAEAKLQIQQLVLDRQLDLVWSFVLEYENSGNPYSDRKRRIALWEDIAADCVRYSPEIEEQASEYMKLGIKMKDASHIACSVWARADYFITTDKKLLNKPVKDIIMINPIDFLGRYYDEK
jgi:predicted nucleic acid-binding protein